jgi:two-component system sensor histidine kinase KdpD
VLLIAVYIGRGPALVAAFASALSWNFLFIEPRLTFEISRTQDIILFMLYFLIALFAGNLTARLKQQEQQARYNSERNLALYRLARDVSGAVDMDGVVHVAVQQIGQAFDAEVGLWLAEGERRLSGALHPLSTLSVDDKEYHVAVWAFDHAKPAGRDTDTLPLALGRYYPLRTTGVTVGVMGVRLRQDQTLTFEQSLLLETFVTQIALVVEREMLDQAAERAAMMAESERLYTTLLNSISHELRTPITAIAGIANTLAAPDKPLKEAARQALGADIQEAAARLNRLVENLLDMSRLDSGRLEVKRDWCDPCDLLGSAAGRLKKRLNGRPLSITCDPEMPLISVDFVLIEQVLVNIIDNACAYTPPEAAIRLEAHIEGNQATFVVEDDGAGIPESELMRIFNKFYRVAGTAAGGTGLGLSIAEGIVSAHGGTISASNAPDAGARFVIRLPLSGTAPQAKEAAL